MTCRSILAELWASGVVPRLTEDGRSLEVPSGRLSVAQRAEIIANRQALIEFLATAGRDVDALLRAAMLACDRHGDGESGRQQMRNDCLATPPHLQADLRDYFEKTYDVQEGLAHEL